MCECVHNAPALNKSPIQGVFSLAPGIPGIGSRFNSDQDKVVTEDIWMIQ